ncbi:MAG: M23 family metallopeptidase [Bacteroidales bacterium]|nr:M23 family metallopeptidase [Candidatus Colimorpha onthohippi]
MNLQHTPIKPHVVIILTLLTLLSYTTSLEAQPKAKKKTFSSPFIAPMNIPLSFSGAFGEIRPNHFHSGIDIRTDGEIGIPVMAAADGYVSRIKISPWGGGNVIYIDHPNCKDLFGHTLRTVYMHLDHFNPKIALWTLQSQYHIQSWSIDTIVAPGVLAVHKGDIIAYSGNSGSSGGPHLHFEIRRAHNDQPLNPVLFGITDHDHTSPIIKDIKLYPASDRSCVNGNTQSRSLPAKINQMTVSGPFFVGINCYDQSETYKGKNGVDDIKLYVDDSLVWHYSIRTFLFENTNLCNYLIDHPTYQSLRVEYLLTRGIPNKKLPGTTYHDYYTTQFHSYQGIIMLATGTHTLRYEVCDAAGNCTTKSFYVQSTNDQLYSEVTHACLPDYLSLIPDSAKIASRLKAKQMEILNDHTPPTIRLCHSKQKQQMPKAKPGLTITFRLSDRGSGIKDYACYLNDKWILAQYDGKKSTLSVTLPTGDKNYGIKNYPSLLPSGNKITVVVTDMADNEAHETYQLY